MYLRYNVYHNVSEYIIPAGQPGVSPGTVRLPDPPARPLQGIDICKTLRLHTCVTTIYGKYFGINISSCTTI